MTDTVIHRAVLTYQENDEKDVVFAQPDEDRAEQGLMAETFMMDLATFQDMGEPTHITIFVVAGDELNKEDGEPRYELEWQSAVQQQVAGQTQLPTPS